MSVWSELKRRKVIRVAAAYAIGGWLLLQLTDVLRGLLELPNLIGRLVVLLIIIGFPAVLTIAWVFDVKADGMVRDRRRAEKRFGVRVDFVLLATVLLLSGWLLYKMWPSGSIEAELAESQANSNEPLREIISAPLENSIAILPFENLSPDPDNAYFAAGLHEEVLHQLARVPDLRVTSRKSVLQYADRAIAIPEIADELHVESVMAGSARFSGNEVRIKAQLIDGESDEHLWVEVYQRELTDIFSIQADIAERIAAQFKTNFLPEDREYIESQTSKSPQALADYLHALSLNWGGPRDKDRALALLDESIAQDPDFASAIALRALVHATSLNNAPESRDDWRARKLQVEQTARSDAEQALELDARQSRAYVALARINQYRWKGVEARDAYEKGLLITPNNIDLLRGYAWFNSVARNHELAIKLAERAVSLDPTNAAAHAELGQRLTFAGNWDAAYAAHTVAASLDPDNGIYHLRVANNEIARGNLAQALDELRTAETFIDPSNASPDLLAELAYAYSRAGSEEDAQRIVGIIRSESLNKHVGIGANAMSLLALGQYSEALVLLKEAATGVIKNGIVDGGFKSLAQISANVLADPELEHAEYIETRSLLTFWDLVATKSMQD
jgi:TolB-like protein/Tfp pilus assembly protein PilF